MKNAKTLQLVQMALLAALVIVLQLFFSAIRVGIVTLSFVLVPIVIAGIFIHPLAGALIGLLAGVTTLIQVFTSADPFYVFMVTNNPAATAAICLVKTTAAGYLSGVVYRSLAGINKNAGTAAAAAVCPIVNTGLFCLGMLVFFYESITTLGEAVTANGVVYYVFIVLAGINFIVELILNLILCPVIGGSLRKTRYFRNV